MTMKIGLWGFYGLGNLGDAAIQQAVIHNIRRRVPDAQIFAICLGPADINRRFGIPAYPIYRGPVAPGGCSESAPPETALTDTRGNDGGFPHAEKRAALQRMKQVPLLRQLIYGAWLAREELSYLRKIYELVSGLDLLAVSGSGVLDDTWRGRWKRPFALYRWCLIAKIAKTRLVFVSIGATSLNSRLGKYFGRKALELAAYRSFRDEESRALARRLGVGSQDAVLPDLAYSLDVQAMEPPAPSGSTVSIGPIPYCDPRVWPEKDAQAYEAYIEKLSSLVEWLMRRGFSIRFIVGEMRVDRWAAKDVIDTLSKSGALPKDGIAQPTISTVDELMDEIARTDYVITSRFHGVLLPYLLAKPVLALSYNSKIENLMESAGQRRYCLDIRTFDLASCTAAFEAMVANKATTTASLQAQRIEYRTALDAQYDLIFNT